MHASSDSLHFHAMGWLAPAKLSLVIPMLLKVLRFSNRFIRSFSTHYTRSSSRAPVKQPECLSWASPKCGCIGNNLPARRIFFYIHKQIFLLQPLDAQIMINILRAWAQTQRERMGRGEKWAILRLLPLMLHATTRHDSLGLCFDFDGCHCFSRVWHLEHRPDSPSSRSAYHRCLVVCNHGCRGKGFCLLRLDGAASYTS
jgi:hypothetical protein